MTLAEPAEAAVHVWRLTREQHRQRALAGIGASRYGGRWNPPGVAVGYAAGSLELAVLESFVRLRIDRPPLDYRWIEFEVPDDAIASMRDLPSEWDSPGPYRSEVQAVGAAWVSEGESLALRVPAAVLPERQNVLINPTHPRFSEIRELATAPFSWPRRLLAYGQLLEERDTK